MLSAPALAPPYCRWGQDFAQMGPNMSPANYGEQVRQISKHVRRSCELYDVLEARGTTVVNVNGNEPLRPLDKQLIEGGWRRWPA